MPRAGQLRVEPGRRLSDRVALGVLTATFPRRLVDAVIEATGRREQRNRLLPAHLTVYYVLAMTLFSSSGYEEVMRSLTEGPVTRHKPPCRPWSRRRGAATRPRPRRGRAARSPGAWSNDHQRAWTTRRGTGAQGQGPSSCRGPSAGRRSSSS